MVHPIIDDLQLSRLNRLYQAQELTPRALGAALLDRLEGHPDPGVWIHVVARADLLKQADLLQERKARGERLPLFGVPFAVKDNIDVAGMPTTAGCPAFSYVPKHSAPVVDSLLDAGAMLIGKNNLDQFATGLAGDRSPYGIPLNPFHADYISGGSSSGSAVAVATGQVSFALASDTAGSGRVPAGLNNLVGFKPAPNTLCSEGLVPACRSLDCLSILALTAGDAWQVYQAARRRVRSGEAELDQTSDTKTQRPGQVFATPRDEDLEFFGDSHQRHLFRRSLQQFEEMGWQRRSVDFGPFREIGQMLYEGPWLAERFAPLEEFLKNHLHGVLPVTRAVIQRGANYSAAELFRAGYRLEKLRRECQAVFEEAAVLLVPTVPAVPTVAAVQADSIGWSRRLGFYTNFANFLRLTALALPAGFTPHGLPGGITLLAPEGCDEFLCRLGVAWQSRVQRPSAGTLPAPSGSVATVVGGPAALASKISASALPEAEKQVRVAVAGAHLRGQPLFPALCQTGARLVRACRTKPQYRFLALMDLDPPRPGLVRDEGRAGAIEVEIYDLPMEGFGRLVASVAPPLAIGTIDLEDGESVKGFLCESWAARSARDITDFGGWVAFRSHLARNVQAGVHR